MLNFWNKIHQGAVLLTWFTATWWWRAAWLPMPDDRLYFARFGFAGFVGVALLAWSLGGWRGLGGVMDGGRWVWVLLLVQLALWARVSYGADVRNANVALSAATQFLVVVAFALSVLSSPPPTRWIIYTLAGAMVLQAGVGLAQVSLQQQLGISRLDVAGLGIKELALDPHKPGVSVVGAARYLRPYGLSAHPNLLAGGLVLGLCALWGNLHRRWALGALVVGLYALLLTFSRAAWGGLLVGCLFASLRPKPALPRGFLLIPATLLLFVLLHAPLITGRFDSGSAANPTFQTFSAASRAAYQEQAILLIRQNPLLGVGMGNFAWESARMFVNDPRDLRGDHVHNIYLLALAEVGGVGFVLFIGAVLVGLGMGWRNAQPEQYGLWAGLVAWLAIGFFDHYPWTQFGHQLLFWGIFAALLHRPTANNT